MTALQAGTAWHLARPRIRMLRGGPAQGGRVRRGVGLSRAAHCSALVAALTWAVALAPAVEAQHAAVRPPVRAEAVAARHVDALPPLGLREVLGELRAGRGARDGIHLQLPAAEAFPAFASYGVVEAPVIALPLVAQPGLQLAAHPSAFANAFATPVVPSAVPASRSVTRVSSSAAPRGTAPSNHFPIPAVPPTDPGIIPATGGDDGDIDPPVERPVEVPPEVPADPRPVDEHEGSARPDLPETDEPDASGPPPLASDPVLLPVGEPAPDPGPEPPAATPPPPAPLRPEVIAWLQHRLGLPQDPVPADPSDPEELARWTALLEICAPHGTGQVAACVEANERLLAAWGRAG